MNELNEQKLETKRAPRSPDILVVTSVTIRGEKYRRWVGLQQVVRQNAIA